MIDALSKLDLKALLISFFVGSFFTWLLVLLVTVAFLFFEFCYGGPCKSFQSNIDGTFELTYRLPLMFIVLLIGILGSVLVGFLTAKLAKHDKILNVYFMALIFTLLSFVTISVSKMDLWYEILSLAVVFPSVYFGGLLFFRRKPIND